jgi:hypothetical protein
VTDPVTAFVYWSFLKNRIMKTTFTLATVFVFIWLLTGTSMAAPPTYTGTVIAYDGWLDQVGVEPFTIAADTLIVVSNGHPTGSFNAAIQVYDYNGNYLGSHNFFVGPVQQVSIPPQNYGWITLGTIVGRPTEAPLGLAKGEKFFFEISTTTSFPPIVEIKQVIYDLPPEIPAGEAIWNSENFKAWTETSLGGNKGNGVVYP